MNKDFRSWKDVQAAKQQLGTRLVSQEIRWMNHYEIVQQSVRNEFTVGNVLKKGIQYFFNISSFKSTSGLAMKLGYKVSQFLFRKKGKNNTPIVVSTPVPKQTIKTT